MTAPGAPEADGRDAFHDELIRLGYRRDRNAAGEYVGTAANFMWMGWQARAQAIAAPVGERGEAVADEVIGVAQALEQRRALKIVADVEALAKDLDHVYSAGFAQACEEVTHRLRTEVWDGCLPPVDASSTPGAPSAFEQSRATNGDVSPPPADARDVTHRHVRRGTEYREMARGLLQCASAVAEGVELVSYVGTDGLHWFRPAVEFDDSRRFERIDRTMGGE